MCFCSRSREEIIGEEECRQGADVHSWPSISSCLHILWSVTCGILAGQRCWGHSTCHGTTTFTCSGFSLLHCLHVDMLIHLVTVGVFLVAVLTHTHAHSTAATHMHTCTQHSGNTHAHSTAATHMHTAQRQHTCTHTHHSANTHAHTHSTVPTHTHAHLSLIHIWRCRRRG